MKRIQTWDVPASKNSEQVAGVTASTVTQMIYVATRGRLGAFDLATEKKVWENTYDGQCCERPQISPDGSFLYVGSDLKDFWYVVNPRTGALIAEAEQLVPVLDVSAATAREVVKRRTAVGEFKTLEELKRIPGVDPAKLEARRERLLF